MKSLRLVAIALLLSSSCFAQAVETTKGFADWAEMPINELIADGQEQVGDVNLHQLLTDIRGLKWQVTHGILAVGSGSRTGAVYYTRDKTIVVNPPGFRDLANEVVMGALLHECLGALGYPDEDYQLSLSIVLRRPWSRAWFRNQSVAALTEPYVAHLARFVDTPVYAMEGGTTSVGGGGDPLALSFKLQTLQISWLWFQRQQRAAKTMTVSYDELFTKIMRAKFELGKSSEVQNSNTALQVQLGTPNRITIEDWAWNFVGQRQPDVSYVYQVLGALAGIP